jgi:DNA-binding MarR family transcriptional regulator
MTNHSKNLLSLEQIIDQVTHLISDMEASAFQQDGFSELSMRQVLYMDTIARLGHPNYSELADALGITRPSVTTLVGKLIRNGFVERIQDGEDRRSFHIVLTQKGQQFSQIHQKMHQQIVQALITHLNESEVEQLAALLNKAVGR